jgi:alcohol dehydrogenase (quinone), cytochrome c subunit
MKFSKSVLTVILAIAGLTAFAQNPAAQDMSHGEYVARLGNCVACHSVEGGEPFAGGLKMAVPRLGTIYTTNITPDPQTGIGDYSFDDFDTAMRKGVAKDGHHLYPAMPYPSYAKILADDMRALYDYFMTEVEPVNLANQDNDIPAVLNWRWPLAVWNVLFVEDQPYESEDSQSEAWNRGAYLVQGLGHCGACHTPRGRAFQEKGLDESDDEAFLAGAPLDHWSASSLNGDINSGLGRWTEADISEFLKTGKNRYGTAIGTMVEVVNNSTQYMTDGDLTAMAVYLKSLPAVAEAGDTPYAYDEAATLALGNMTFDEPGSVTYYQYCVSCHQYDGGGHMAEQATYMPPLAGNPVVLDPDASSLINLTLNGSLRVIADGRPEHYDMPYFRGALTDEEIADVVSYIRSSWGNMASEVRAADVTEIRDATDPTTNDVVILRMK